jgi:hypothetical protein
VYRGRLDRPSLLLFADQASHDDQFSGRALTGDAGQHLQAFLTAAGLDYRYGILRVLPVDTLAADAAAQRAAVDDHKTVAVYQEALDKSHPTVVVAVGPLSKRLVGNLDAGSKPVIEMKAFGQRGHAADWQGAVSELRSLRYGKDISRPTYDYDGSREQIPRYDLPYGTLRWQASSGDRAQQAQRSNRPSPDYYRLVMPEWAFDLEPEPLTARQRRGLDQLGS